MGRWWRLGGAPALDLTSDGALAATIALGPDLVEQQSRDVLALSPLTRQVGEVRVECGSPTTTGAEEIGGDFSTGETTDRFAI